MSATQTPPTPASSTRAPLAENPWLWVMLFGAMGVVAILVVGPKYAARTARVERMQLMREKIAQDRAAGKEPIATGASAAAAVEVPEPGKGPALTREPYVEEDFGPPTKLLWLLALMGVVLLVGTGGLLVTRSGRGGESRSVEGAAG